MSASRRLLLLSLAFLLIFPCLALAKGQPEPAPGRLIVTGVMPRGEAPRITQVVVRFNRAMVPVGKMEREPDQVPVKLEPRPAGSFRWLDPQTLAYTLKEPMQGSAGFRVVVPAGAKALDGSTLATATMVSVFTPRVDILRLTPKERNVIGPKPTLQLTLNQPVKLESLKKKLYFKAGNKRIDLAIEPKPAPYFLKQKFRLAMTYQIRPLSSLPMNQTVHLLMDGGIEPAQGNLLSVKRYRLPFPTYGPLQFKTLQADRDGQGAVRPENSVSILFNNPIVPKKAAQFIQISPKPAGWEPPSGAYPERRLFLRGDLAPRTRYTVRLLPGLPDEYGTKLAQGQELSFTTGDLAPLFSLASEKGVVEAGVKPHVYPLVLRNVSGARVALKLHQPDQAAQVLAEEATRSWRETPAAPTADGPSASVHQMKFNLSPNQQVIKGLDLDRLLGRPAMGGLLLLDVRADLPDSKGKLKTEVRRVWVQVTDLALSLKLGTTGGLAWVCSLSGGQPLPGVDLRLRNRHGKVVWQGVSGPDGMAKLPPVADLDLPGYPQKTWMGPIAFLMAQKGEDFAVLPSAWSDELGYSTPYDIQRVEPGKRPGLLAHAVTQLPLYQPGQTVRFVVYLRRAAPTGLALPQKGQVEVSVHDAYNRQVKKFTGRLSDFGSVSGEFQSSPTARLGAYSIKVKYQGKGLSAGGFRIASFRPPDFKTSLDLPKNQVGPAAPTAGVSAVYLFGAPVAKGKVTLNLSQAADYFVPAPLEDYAVGDIPLPGDNPGLRKHLGQAETSLGPDGKAKVALPAPLVKPGYTVRYSAEAGVADQAARTVHAAASLLVHPADLYLGLKTEPLAVAGQPVKVEVAGCTAAGKPAGPHVVTLTAYRQYWETVKEKGPGGFYHYISQARREKVWQGAIDGGDKPVSASFTPPKAGAYVVVAQAKDKGGRLNVSATMLWATGGGLAGWPRFDDARVELAMDRKKAAPGDTVRVLIKNPFPKAMALITVEREGVRRQMVREVSGPAPTFDIEVKKEDAPNLFIGVVLTRGRVPAADTGRVDLGKPQVKLGYAFLPVTDPKAGLRVKVAAERDQVRPGQMVAATVSVTRGDGQGAPAEITFLAVDERVLSAAGGVNNYNPLTTFGATRPLAVTTADMRTNVLGRRFMGRKGEQGAGDGGAGGALRRDFHPSVYWLAQKATDDSGRLSVKFKLPDTLTAYRLVAVAADKAGEFGAAKTMVRASKPLQILSALPRFAVMGDRFAARVLVQNFGRKPGEILVTAKAKGIALVGPAQVKVTVAPGEGQAVAFPVEAKGLGTAELTFGAAMDEETDAASFSFQVLPPTSLTTAAAAGVLKPAQGQGAAKVPLLLPADAAPGRGGLTVSVAPSLASVLQAPAKVALEYPYDCLEQRLSKAAARAWRLKFGKRFGLAPAKDDAASIGLVLASVPDFQTGGGGLAYWPGQERADDFLTAWAILAIRQIEWQSGQAVAQGVKKQAIDYLTRKLSQGKPPANNDWYGRLSEALALAALAGEGKDVAGRLESALTRAEGLPPFGLAALLEACAAYQQTEGIAKLVRLLEGTASVSAAGLHFAAVGGGSLKVVMGSTLRGNALALWALSSHLPQYPRLDALARWVAMRLGQESRLSTQEAVVGLWGVGAYLQNAGKPGRMTVKIAQGGQEGFSRTFQKENDPPLSFTKERDLLKPGQDYQVTISADGQGAPLWSARLAWAPAKAPAKPVDAGFQVSRSYRAEKEGAGPTLGERVICNLTLVVSHTRHHVMLFDPFPAGLEPEKAEGGRPVGVGARRWQWDFAELRKSGMLLYAKRLSPGVYNFSYRLRAVAPGNFVMRPAQAEEMYSPEVFGSTPGGVLEVR